MTDTGLSESVRRAVELQAAAAALGHDARVTQGIHWGFDVSSIEPPLIMYFGRSDDLVPMRVGMWMRAACPASRVTFVEGGHGLLFGHMGAVLHDFRAAIGLGPRA